MKRISASSTRPDRKGAAMTDCLPRARARPSTVPRRVFAATPRKQREQLEADPLLNRFRLSRRILAGDPYRPLYHFVSPEAGLNDPNGLCVWQGRWHLFYQAFPPDDPRNHWGHAVSEDLIHWRDLPYALYPDPEEAVWSGATLVEKDRVIAMYFGYPIGNMVAVSRDPLLLNWQKIADRAVIPVAAPFWEPLTEAAAASGPHAFPSGAVNSVYDPCIWKQDGLYYALSGGALTHAPSGQRIRTEFLFRSADLVAWEYLHPFVEGDVFGVAGDDGACPYFLPIGDRHILLQFSHMSGSKYLLGDYDTKRDTFVASSGGVFTCGSSSPGGVHAPTAAPDGNGGVIALFNVKEAKPTPGWDQIVSLPRRLTLAGRDELRIEPAGDIESLRGKRVRVAGLPLPANRELVLETVQGNVMELAVEIDPQDAPMVELNVLRAPGKEEYTRIAFFKERGYLRGFPYPGWTAESLLVVDNSCSSKLPDVRSRAPETAPLSLTAGETLKLRVFIDRSVVEVFANGKQCVTLRVYPGREDSLGVSLRAQGRDARLERLDAWELRSIY